MEILHTHCAGLDVHKKTVVAARRRPAAEGGWDREVRTFGTMTVDLLQLVDWLHAWEVTHVAMESTGEFWKPIYNLLEGEFAVLLVNPRHIQRVEGRKTDVKDADWLADLLAHGLLRASFIPPAPQRDLRDLTRYRTTLVQERARVVTRVQKLLEGANIKLASVASNVLGVSGRAMLEELVVGHSDPAALAQLARGRLRQKLPELEQALTGVVRPHQRFLLATQLAHIDFLDEQVATVAHEIAAQIEAMSLPPELPQALPPTDAPAEPAADNESRTPLSATAAVALLDTIPGIDVQLAQLVVAELGTDMSRFPTDRHAAAWAGLAPGNYESAGKRHSGRIRHGNQSLRSGLVEGAWAAVHTKHTYLAAQYHHLVGRRGQRRALIAVAHSMLVIAYHMLKDQVPYRELGGSYFDERKKGAVTDRLLKRLAKLGYRVSLEPLPVAA